jgi:hypothetical protein
MKSPMQGWIGYKKGAIENQRPTKQTSRCAYVDTPPGPTYEMPPYEKPLAFPNTMRKHMMAYEAGQRAKVAEISQCTPE